MDRRRFEPLFDYPMTYGIARTSESTQTILLLIIILPGTCVIVAGDLMRRAGRLRLRLLDVQMPER
ncbi:MAG: hypothetical protein NVS9B2_29010 [Steroidobacteraceae bacterium]